MNRTLFFSSKVNRIIKCGYSYTKYIKNVRKLSLPNKYLIKLR